MGFFDKKYCDVCGEKIGLLGNRKLEDGNLCKNCAAKLSPWFSERRHSTLADIKEQLAYREENRKKAAQFQTTRSFGEGWRVLLDDTHRWFTVTRERSLAEANPDILDFDALTGCRLDIDQRETELKRRNDKGEMESYFPPRYEYSYDFDIILTVNSPYFDEMRFQLNPSSVKVVSEAPNTFGRSRVGQFLNSGMGGGFDPSYNIEYRQYRQMAEELVAAMNALRGVGGQTGAAPQDARPQQPVPPPAAPESGPWTCPACGGGNDGGKFCQYCGGPRG